MSREKLGQSGKSLFWLWSGLLLVALLLNMAIIFYFSTESMEASGSRSTGLTQWVVGWLYPRFSELSPTEQVHVMERTHLLIRKLAHFSEFGLLGLLSSTLVSHVNRRGKWIKPCVEWLWPLLFCLLYAISDEVHQIFSHRGACLQDVVIDFTGAACGILLLRMVSYFLSLARSKRKEFPPCDAPATN